MKLELIKAENVSMRQYSPTMSISGKGLITFNKPATEELELAGKRINFLFDKKDPSNWYLQIAKNGELLLGAYKDNNAKCNSASIAIQIKKSTSHDVSKALKVKIGKPIEHDGDVIFPLLIKKGDVPNFKNQN